MSELLDSEQILLGQCVLDEGALTQASSLLKPEDFSDPSHGRLFAALLKGRNEGVGGIAVAELFSPDKRSSVRKFLSKILDGLPRSSDVRAWADIIKRESIRRQAGALYDSFRLALDQVDEDPYENLQILAQKAMALKRTQGRQEWADNRTLAQEALRQIERRVEAPKGLIGLPTGLSDVDTKLSGLRPGQMIGIGGRPGSGKTALLQQVAKHIASQGTDIALFSLEMSAVEVTEREIASEARVNLTTLYFQRKDELAESMRRIVQAWETAATPHLHKVDGSFSLEEIESLATEAVTRWDVKAIFLDYLQLIRTPKSARRHEALADVSRGLKSLAMRLRVPLILACQLNRAPEARSDRRPSLGDISETDGPARDCHAVILIHQKPEGTELCIEKNRSGFAGIARCRFVPEHCRFEDSD